MSSLQCLHPPYIAIVFQVTCAQVGKAPMQECMREVQGLPVLIITGAKDRCANDLLMRRFLRDS